MKFTWALTLLMLRRLFMPSADFAALRQPAYCSVGFEVALHCRIDDPLAVDEEVCRGCKAATGLPEG